MSAEDPHAGGPAGAAEEPIPLIDLRAQHRELAPELLEAVRGVMESAAFALGPAVSRFEEAFAGYLGARRCVGLNSGTSALHLALLGAGVGPGDEVITVPLTFVATCWGITYLGARPVFVDVDSETWTMDPAGVESRITPRTRALLPVHLYGQPADMEPLLALGEKHGIPVIEDACQAHGARYAGRPAGTLGRAGCFSFYPSKNLGACGEAGAVVTGDDALADRLRALRDHAQTERYHCAEVGFNYRMEGLQGAVLEVKLKRLDSWVAARRRLASRYQEALAGLPLELPRAAAGREHAWHLFVVLHPERDRLRRELERRGIAAGLHYPVPVHLQPAYRHLGGRPGDFPAAERVARECLSLPLYPELSEAQQDRVVRVLHEFLDGASGGAGRSA